MTKRLPPDAPRCKAEKQCPSAGRCRRHLDTWSALFAAWEARREAGAERCDGFLPINPDSL